MSIPVPFTVEDCVYDGCLVHVDERGACFDQKRSSNCPSKCSYNLKEKKPRAKKKQTVKK